MHVMGVKSHSPTGITFYVSMPNVKSNASYLIHCLLSEIERHMINNNGKRPHTLYIQIDGASDNTAKAVTACLEHLVLQDFCERIEIWRLPVGHTHEVKISNHDCL